MTRNLEQQLTLLAKMVVGALVAVGAALGFLVTMLFRHLLTEGISDHGKSKPPNHN